MGGNILVINVDIRETRVALIEEGILTELHIERTNSKSTLGNVYLGTVSRVLPGMQAAFIEIGQERAAFLHVEDLIRPDDFEDYLVGVRRSPSLAEDDIEQAESKAGGESATIDTGAGGGGTSASDESVAAEAALPADDASSKARYDEPLPGYRVEEIDLPEAEVEQVDAAEAEIEQVDAPEPEAEDSNAPEPEAEGSDAPEPEAEGSDAPEPEAEDSDAPEPEAEDSDAPKAEVEEIAEDLDLPGVQIEDLDATEAVEDLDLPAVQVEDIDPSAEGGFVPVFTKEDGGVTSTDGKARTATKRARAAPEQEDEARSKTTKRATSVGRSRRPSRRTKGGSKSSRSTARASKRDKAGSQTTRGQSTRGREASTGRGKSRRRGRGGDTRAGGARTGRGRGKTSKSKVDRSRIPKSTPIREVVREGQQVVVQVCKEPIGTKGARVTSHISLPGRYVVYLPTVEHVGISKRIGSDKERSRLRDAIESAKPPTGGLVVRTVAEGLTKKHLKADVGYLIRLWAEIAHKRELATKAPNLLYEELDLALKTARDLFTEDVERIVIDDREQYVRLRRFVEMFLPERVECVELYEGREPVFDAYGIEDEIGRALSRKVPLASGGYLIIDQAEALTAIDVNTGRYVGKGSKDLEETILQTNLEAVEEIAYQLRFRNIGGLIILDLIDMERPANREKVRRRLDALLAKDKAKTTLNRISELGLIEMTRKRTRESLGRLLHEPCFYCDGTGQLQSKETIAYEILRQIRRELVNLKGFRITVNAHPAIVDLLKNDEADAVREAERLFTRRIELVSRKEYHIEQYDLQGI